MKRWLILEWTGRWQVPDCAIDPGPYATETEARAAAVKYVAEKIAESCREFTRFHFLECEWPENPIDLV